MLYEKLSQLLNHIKMITHLKLSHIFHRSYSYQKFTIECRINFGLSIHENEYFHVTEILLKLAIQSRRLEKHPFHKFTITM